MRKAGGVLVDFASLFPKFKTMPRVIPSYTNAVVDAIWNLKTLAEKRLCFDVVRSGDKISKRMPTSQRHILRCKL